MARTTVTTVTTLCDDCTAEVTDPSYVGAMTYGKTFHLKCWADLGGPIVARLLGLDEIRILVNSRDGSYEEVPDARFGATRTWFGANS